MSRTFALAFALAACGQRAVAVEPPVTPRGPVERYGFVTLLGNDTIAVERVSRTANTIISDDVDRFPLVRVRHTEMEIAPDGRLARMIMDVRTPSGTTPARRSRRVVAHFTADSVLVTVEDSAGTKVVSFATAGALTMPHVSMLYSVIEFEIAAAMQRAGATHGVGDTLTFRQFYPDRDVGRSFVLHHGWVHPLGAGKVELWHDWLAGYGDVVVDSAGRMLSYSGMRSTYKVSVTRTNDLPNVEAVTVALTKAEALAGANELSVRDMARGTIGNAAITVDYGRPLARGRVLLGNVVPYDQVWRTGANAATQFTTSVPITLAGLSLPAGKYTLWTIPHANRVELVVNKETGQWGTEYDGSLDLGRAAMQSDTAATPVEKFAITVRSDDATHGALVMEWGNFRWTAPIVVK